MWNHVREDFTPFDYRASQSSSSSFGLLLLLFSCVFFRNAFRMIWWNEISRVWMNYTQWADCLLSTRSVSWTDTDEEWTLWGSRGEEWKSKMHWFQWICRHFHLWHWTRNTYTHTWYMDDVRSFSSTFSRCFLFLVMQRWDGEVFFVSQEILLPSTKSNFWIIPSRFVLNTLEFIPWAKCQCWMMKRSLNWYLGAFGRILVTSRARSQKKETINMNILFFSPSSLSLFTRRVYLFQAI